MSSRLSFNSAIFWLGIFCLFIQLPIKCTANTVQIQDIDKLNISNRNLKNRLKRIQKSEQLPLTEEKATNLLKTALHEPYDTQEIVGCLLGFFEKKDYSFSKHEVMLEALKYAQKLSLIEYLLENRIYDVDYLKASPFRKKVHDQHHLFSNLPLVKFCIMMVASSYKLTSFEDFLYQSTKDSKTIIFLKSFLYQSTKDNKTIIFLKNFLYQNIKEGPLGFLYKYFSILFYPLISIVNYICPHQILKNIKELCSYYNSASYIYFISKLLYIYHIGQKIDTRENYIISVLSVESRTKKEKQDIALTLLKHGVSPHTKVFYVKAGTGPKPRKELETNTYQELSVLHKAAELDQPFLVKKLIECGVNINLPAVLMKDIFNPLSSTSEPTLKDMLNLLDYVNVQDIYNKKGANFVYQTPLDFAPKGSKTAQYLKKQGGKYYKDLKKPTLLPNNTKLLIT